MSSGKIAIYVEKMSQPSRALWWLCKLNEDKVPYELVAIQIAKGDHLTPEYAKVNPQKKVPAMRDGDFVTGESNAILRYIVTKFNLPEHWYPRKDLQQQAKINEYLDWHHTNTRMGMAGTFQNKYLFPLTGRPVDQAWDKRVDSTAKYALKTLDGVFLGKGPFIGGMAEPSIADLQAYEELVQNRLINIDFSAYPKITAWIARIEALPHYKETHEILLRAIAKQQASKAAKL